MAPPLEDIVPAFKLNGANFIVTGGAQGIGLASVRVICEAGGNVAVLDIREKPEDEFDSFAAKFNVKTFYVQADLTKQNQLESGFAKAVEHLGTVHGLVPAAGIAIDKPFVDQTWEEFTSIQEINVSLTYMYHINHNTQHQVDQKAESLPLPAHRLHRNLSSLHKYIAVS